MGRVHSEAERAQTLQKARDFKVRGSFVEAPTTVSDIQTAFADELYTYFCLCNASRTARTSVEVREEALGLVFRFRTSIEKKIVSELGRFSDDVINGGLLYRHNMFSFSKKQGVSFRFPLTTCVPSRKCASLCYAHDRLDAAPFAVIKGAVNEFIARVFQQTRSKKIIENYLWREVKKAIKHALREARLSKFKRDPRIRLAHVGEMPAYPDFTKYINSMIHELSNGRVKLTTMSS